MEIVRNVIEVSDDDRVELMKNFNYSYINDPDFDEIMAMDEDGNGDCHRINMLSDDCSIVKSCLTYIEERFNKEFCLMNVNYYTWKEYIPPHHDIIGGYPIVIFTFYDRENYTPRIFEATRKDGIAIQYETHDGDMIINTESSDKEYMHSIKKCTDPHDSVRISMVFGLNTF